MAVNVPELQPLLAIPGVRIGTANAGIKQRQRDDMVVMALDEGVTVAGVFTRSVFRAAPVKLAEARLARARALVINSGNANAATGEAGELDAAAVCDAVGESLPEIEGLDVLPFSTGVIGARLPVEAMRRGAAEAVQKLREDGWNAAARAIMTTDTVPKGKSVRVTLGDGDVTVTGIAKGAGMIKPDMATMLAFMATDAAVPRSLLQPMLQRVADISFNRVTVDGDTSTNDSLVLIATGRGNVRIDGADDPRLAELERALTDVAQSLAQWIARDGEGATRFVTVRVRGGVTSADCLKVAYAIAESPLVKTAIFAGDPNWGRFCMAIGRAGAEVDPGRVALYLDDVCIARNGMVADGYQEADAARVMAQSELTVLVDLGLGSAEEWVWTCDFSYDYVKINAEYRS
ncbi:MAG: bifunctional glutamate N-acetyltransferase/amino-acid acetyltransferase ArgJ [Pseudomonadales bacterium]|nr:bifunctional glutamate N-acetyltransferase/amino-acid acetyltransferase ArgJ [Pseudomonadales bacterium]MCP5185343.1 bifunctional glutamate N-acetyltransferase/amino-acid acetyltransferase ArgJ [Pseudomonadales bacterium]